MINFKHFLCLLLLAIIIPNVVFILNLFKLIIKIYIALQIKNFTRFMEYIQKC